MARSSKLARTHKIVWVPTLLMLVGALIAGAYFLLVKMRAANYFPPEAETVASATDFRFRSRAGEEFVITIPPTMEVVDMDSALIKLKIRHSDDMTILIDTPPHGFGEGDETVQLIWSEEPITINEKQYKFGSIYRGDEVTQFIYVPQWTDKLGNIEVSFCCRERVSVKLLVEEVLQTLKTIDTKEE